MNRCPVCDTLCQERTVCPRCGFDESMDYEAYVTLAPVPEDAVPVSVLRKAWNRPSTPPTPQRQKGRGGLLAALGVAAVLLLVLCVVKLSGTGSASDGSGAQTSPSVSETVEVSPSASEEVDLTYLSYAGLFEDVTEQGITVTLEDVQIKTDDSQTYVAEAYITAIVELDETEYDISSITDIEIQGQVSFDPTYEKSLVLGDPENPKYRGEYDEYQWNVCKEQSRDGVYEVEWYYKFADLLVPVSESVVMEISEIDLLENTEMNVFGTWNFTVPVAPTWEGSVYYCDKSIVDGYSRTDGYVGLNETAVDQGISIYINSIEVSEDGLTFSVDFWVLDFAAEWDYKLYPYDKIAIRTEDIRLGDLGIYEPVLMERSGAGDFTSLQMQYHFFEVDSQSDLADTLYIEINSLELSSEDVAAKGVYGSWYFAIPLEDVTEVSADVDETEIAEAEVSETEATEEIVETETYPGVGDTVTYNDEISVTLDSYEVSDDGSCYTLNFYYEVDSSKYMESSYIEYADAILTDTEGNSAYYFACESSEIFTYESSEINWESISYYFEPEALAGLGTLDTLYVDCYMPCDYADGNSGIVFLFSFTIPLNS